MAVRTKTRFASQRGFTLTEMLIATVVVLVGLVAVAQLVPSSVLLNSNNRNDGTALVLAQRELEAMSAVPLTSSTFTDPLGVLCPPATACNLGDPAQPSLPVGNPVVPFNNALVVDFSAAPVAGYSFTYADPNDPFGSITDVRWTVFTFTNATGIITGRRIILGVFRRGMKTPTYPITLDTMVSK